ncbi:hypothetical protein LguiB_002076 [Lonicera macranthoides]
MGKPIPIEVLASVLKDFTPEEQQRMIAGNLCPLNEVLHLLEYLEAFKAKLAEAMDVLRNVNESPSAAIDDELDALSLSDDDQ